MQIIIDPEISTNSKNYSETQIPVEVLDLPPGKSNYGVVRVEWSKSRSNAASRLYCSLRLGSRTGSGWASKTEPDKKKTSFLFALESAGILVSENIELDTNNKIQKLLEKILPDLSDTSES